MNSFAAWGLTLFGLAVVSTVAEMLLPRGKTKSVIRSVFATVAVLVIVTPLPGLIKSGFKFDFTSDTVTTDTDYLEYIDGIKRKAFETAVRASLEEKGYPKDAYDLTVVTDGGYGVKSVTVKLVGSGITENGAHINKSEMKRLIAEFFGISEEAVMTYG